MPDGMETTTAGGSTITRDMVDVLACVFTGRSAVYVSAPITSGRRFFDLQARREAEGAAAAEIDAAMLTREVIEPNIAEASAIVQAIRRRFGMVVIDPSALVVPDWEQHHYVALWGAVVRRYAETVVFAPGWELSSGCTYEFVVACDEGIPALDAELRALSCRGGSELIARAAAELDARGVRAPYLTERLSQLRALPLGAESATGAQLASGDRAALCSHMLGTVALARSVVVMCSPAGGRHAQLIDGLRKRAALVADTSAFAPRHWSAEQVDDLWRRAIEAYACEVVLAPGWQHDVGCVHAFYHAARLGIRITSAGGDPLSLDEGVRLVETAAAGSEGARPARLRTLLGQMMRIHHVA